MMLLLMIMLLWRRRCPRLWLLLLLEALLHRLPKAVVEPGAGKTRREALKVPRRVLKRGNRCIRTSVFAYFLSARVNRC